MSRGLEDALASVVDALERAGIDYTVSGALAMADHGYPRATRALDLQVRVETHQVLDDAREHVEGQPRRVDALTWSMGDRWDVGFHPVRDQLAARAVENRVEGRLFEGDDRRYWIAPLDALLVLKVREHLRFPQDLERVDDVLKLLARNHDALDVDELDQLLELNPDGRRTWEEQVEPDRGGTRSSGKIPCGGRRPHGAPPRGASPGKEPGTRRGPSGRCRPRWTPGIPATPAGPPEHLRRLQVTQLYDVYNRADPGRG